MDKEELLRIKHGVHTINRDILEYAVINFVDIELAKQDLRLKIKHSNRKGEKKVKSFSKDMKKDDNIFPIEIREKYKKYHIFLNHNDRVYLKKNDTTVAIAKLVWDFHNPDDHVETREKIIHIDGDYWNNKIDNLKKD